MEVTESRALLKVPHKNGEITFVYPPFKGTLEAVARQIDDSKLSKSISEQIASLVYDAWQKPEGRYESKIIQLLKDAWLWEFTGNLYIPKEKGELTDGVFLQDNPEIRDGKLYMNREELAKKMQSAKTLEKDILISEDGTIRFVPFGFKTGEIDKKDFAKYPYIIGRYGAEGAEKIAKVAEKYINNPWIYVLTDVSTAETRASAVYECHDLWLGFLGDDHLVDGKDCCALGVLK